MYLNMYGSMFSARILLNCARKKKVSLLLSRRRLTGGHIRLTPHRKAKLISLSLIFASLRESHCFMKKTPQRNAKCVLLSFCTMFFRVCWQHSYTRLFVTTPFFRSWFAIHDVKRTAHKKRAYVIHRSLGSRSIVLKTKKRTSYQADWHRCIVLSFRIPTPQLIALP